jgi:hypothetical protein
MIKTNLYRAITIVASFAVIATLQSCSKLAQSLVFNNLNLQPGALTFTIPANPDTNAVITLGSATNSYNVDSFIKANTANQLGVSNINSVKLASCVITITAGASTTNNLANFQSCNASFYSNTETAPFVLSVPNNPDTYATTLTMPVDTTTELKSYLSGTNFNYSVSGKLRRPTTAPLTCTVNYSFTMSVRG